MAAQIKRQVAGSTAFAGEATTPVWHAHGAAKSRRFRLRRHPSRARRFASMAPKTLTKAIPESAPPTPSGAPTEHPPASSGAELGVVPAELLDAGGVAEPGVAEGTQARRESVRVGPASSSMQRRSRHVPVEPFSVQAAAALASAHDVNADDVHTAGTGPDSA